MLAQERGQIPWPRTGRVGPSKAINCFTLFLCEREPWKMLGLREWNRKSGAGERREKCLGVTEGNGMGCGVLPRDGACRGWVCPSHAMPLALRARGQTRSILSPNIMLPLRVVYSPCPQPPGGIPSCISLRGSVGSWRDVMVHAYKYHRFVEGKRISTMVVLKDLIL